jgi:hypothetical protein
MSKRDIADLRGRIRDLRKELISAVHETYPVGEKVFYTAKSGHPPICCVVIAWGYDTVLIIRNVSTGKDRRVDGDSELLEPKYPRQAVLA